MTTPSLEDMMKWPQPDYDNPHEPLDAVIYGVNIPLMVVMTVFVAGRFLSRTYLVRNALGIDDWTMLIAYVRTSLRFRLREAPALTLSKILAMAMSACQLVEPKYGIGRHLYDVRPQWLPSLGKVCGLFVNMSPRR
jgi:hypothetical protein